MITKEEYSKRKLKFKKQYLKFRIFWKRYMEFRTKVVYNERK
jgi:hypothetical protein